MEIRFSKRKGLILPMVVVAFVFLAIVVPLLIKMVRDDTSASVADQKKSVAFNLAEAAVDRGYWKIKSSTITLQEILDGGVISGYDYDATYDDVAGGSYRIRIASGPLEDQITITGEGKAKIGVDKFETRAIEAIYQNTAVSGAIISGGMMSATGNSVVHWGPIMSMGDLTVSGAVLNNHYPRKLSKGVVKPLDPTGDLNPSNTDNLEWWSDYPVPELPLFNFTELRSSAAATGTLNCQTKSGNIECCFLSSCTYSGAACSDCSIQNLNDDSRISNNYTWYWDNDATWTGKNGARGTMIVRGDLRVTGGGNYCSGCDLEVPATAWQEYQKIDTTSTDEYPGDTGYQSNATTYHLDDDLGVYGFLYVGGTFDRQGDCDVYGAIWVVGNISGNGNTAVYYNSKIKLPMLNVIIIRRSWQEIAPSAEAWI